MKLFVFRVKNVLVIEITRLRKCFIKQCKTFKFRPLLWKSLFSGRLKMFWGSNYRGYSNALSSILLSKTQEIYKQDTSINICSLDEKRFDGPCTNRSSCFIKLRRKLYTTGTSFSILIFVFWIIIKGSRISEVPVIWSTCKS